MLGEILLLKGELQTDNRLKKYFVWYRRCFEEPS